MSKVWQVKCDAPKCSQVRASTNHWFLLRAENGQFTASALDGSAEMDGDRHLCGRQCLQTMLEDWMERLFDTKVVVVDTPPEKVVEEPEDYPF